MPALIIMRSLIIDVLFLGFDVMPKFIGKILVPLCEHAKKRIVLVLQGINAILFYVPVIFSSLGTGQAASLVAAVAVCLSPSTAVPSM